MDDILLGSAASFRGGEDNGGLPESKRTSISNH